MTVRTHDLTDAAVRTRLEAEALAPYLRRQRWFGGKARAIASARFSDWAPLATLPHPAWLVIAEVAYADGGAERYQLPLCALPAGAAERAAAERPETVLAPADGDAWAICDAIMDDAACRAMVDAVAREAVLPGQHGRFEARAAEGPGGDRLEAHMSIVRLPGVHSNSALAVGGRYLLKLFRRIEPGINPDVEIGLYLARCGANVHVPALAGTIEYRAADGQPATLALIQALVASRANAWEHALAELADYFAAARGEAATAQAAGRLAEASLLSIALLGRRTAELHLALASATAAQPDFVPEVSSPADVAAAVSRINTQAAAALDLLADRRVSLGEEAQEMCGRVLARRRALLDRVAHLGRDVEPFVRIRIHGDYHLGQVLRVHDDFVIIDFEGEPTRSLAERRAKQSPLRDVAGLLRSLSYASHAGLMAAGAGDPQAHTSLAPWAREWEAATAGAFMREYLAVAGKGSFLPADPAQLRQTLDLFTLEKALYELNYELNNRPDWVSAPLAGILALA